MKIGNHILLQEYRNNKRQKRPLVYILRNIEIGSLTHRVSVHIQNTINCNMIHRNIYVHVISDFFINHRT